MLPNNNWQKSPQRRFLLILGATLFVVIFVAGLFIIFDKKILPTLPPTQRLLFGILIILYAVLRFYHVIRKRQNEV
jgi:antibiotic biosynthesis monooxygenase (ABM) superfamily enzyme